MEQQVHSLTDRQQYWLEQIHACEASGQSMKAYAAAQALDIKALYSWKKALVKKGVLPRTRAPRFQRAQVVDAVVGGEWQIQLPNGVSVAFTGPMDAGTLSTVLNTAAAVE